MRTLLTFGFVFLFLLFGYILLGIFWIYRKFNENINVTGFPLRLYSDTRYELSQVETRIKKESTGDKVASKLGDIANSIGIGKNDVLVLVLA